jgi:predicted nucleic acid-binding protein
VAKQPACAWHVNVVGVFCQDDRTARRQAEKWHIPVSGTIGILVAAIRIDRLSLADANTLLHSMIVAANYRAPLIDLGLLL